MGFFDKAATLGGGIGGSLLGGPAGGALGASLGSTLGAGGQGGNKRNLREGYEADTKAFKERSQYSWDMAEDRGLTPQEFYGSSASGGTSASGNVQALGNQANQKEMQNKKLQTDTALKMADLSLQARGQDKQVEAAEVGAGASMYSTDVKAAIAQGQLDLNRQTYQNVTLPQAAAKIGLTEQQTAKAINEVATSDPKFMTLMKQLSMGVDNMLVEYFQRHNGINLHNPGSFTSLPVKKREELLGAMLAMTSNVYKEGKGAAALGSSAVDGGTSIIDSLKSILGNPLGLHNPIEQTPGKGLGNKFKPPPSYKRRGYAGPQPFKSN